MIQAATILDGPTHQTHPPQPTVQHLLVPLFHAPSTFLGYPDLTSFLQAWLPIIFMGVLVVA
ncbi:MAG TPA: hypothetical protein VMA96_06155, partial [Solirubrobacteraceae bacterium]|nr:hypothetical protein [Solirubrobacteraceae bacterium]